MPSAASRALLALVVLSAAATYACTPRAASGVALFGALLVWRWRKPARRAPSPPPPPKIDQLPPGQYLLGYNHDTAEPLLVSARELCTHLGVVGATGAGKTLFMLALLAQQAEKGLGALFVDAKRDLDTLAHVVAIAEDAGRLADLVVVDPLRPERTSTYAPFAANVRQRPEVKARKALRTALPLTSDTAPSKHYDRLAHDAVSRLVRALEAPGLAWHLGDLATALGHFAHAYPILRQVLLAAGRDEALGELELFASSYRGPKGHFDAAAMTDNLRGVASDLHALAAAYGPCLNAPVSGLVLSEAISERKLVYFMLPRLEDPEGTARLARLLREDIEVSVGERVTAGVPDDEPPFLVLVDEAASLFGPSWASLFELSRKGRFAFAYGVQSTGGIKDSALGLSREFFARVFANTATKIALRVGDAETAEDLSQWFGEVDVWRKSRSVAKSRGLGMSALKHVDLNAGLYVGKSRVDGESEARERRVKPEDLTHHAGIRPGLAWVDRGGGRIERAWLAWSSRPQVVGGYAALERLPRAERYASPQQWHLAEQVRQRVLRDCAGEPAVTESAPEVAPEPPEPEKPPTAFKARTDDPPRRRVGSVMRLRMP